MAESPVDHFHCMVFALLALTLLALGISSWFSATLYTELYTDMCVRYTDILLNSLLIKLLW